MVEKNSNNNSKIEKNNNDSKKIITITVKLKKIITIVKNSNSNGKMKKIKIAENRRNHYGS